MNSENELSGLIINTEPREDHQVAMKVVLEPSLLEGAKHRAARKISSRKPISGFRPGKAPYDVILRTYGESLIVDEALDLLVEEIYPKALKQSELEPGAPGKLENIEHLDSSPEFHFIVPLSPKVELRDYHTIRVPYEWKEPGEKDLDQALEDLRNMYAKTETVDREVGMGDFVLIDLKALNLTATEGPSNDFSRTGFPIFIRQEEREDEWPYSGFSKELIGSKANDSKIITHKFSKKHPDEKLSGQKVDFEITIRMVRGTIRPDLTDEFAKQVGPFENLQALREAVNTNLIAKSKAEYEDEYFTKAIEALGECAKIKYAPQTLEHELEHVMTELKERLGKQNLDLATYLKSREMDEETFKNSEALPAARKRLERSLLLDEFSKLEKIEVNKEMLDSSFKQTMNDFAGSEDFQKLMKGRTQPPKRLINYVAIESANRAYLQETLNRLKSVACGEIERTKEFTNKEVASPAKARKNSQSKSQKAKTNKD